MRLKKRRQIRVNNLFTKKNAAWDKLLCRAKIKFWENVQYVIIVYIERVLSDQWNSHGLCIWSISKFPSSTLSGNRNYKDNNSCTGLIKWFCKLKKKNKENRSFIMLHVRGFLNDRYKSAIVITKSALHIALKHEISRALYVKLK